MLQFRRAVIGYQWERVNHLLFTYDQGQGASSFKSIRSELLLSMNLYIKMSGMNKLAE